MKTLLLTLILCTSLIAAKEETIHHPEPQKPVFLSETWYPSLKKSILPPPTMLSEKQKKDVAEIYRLQKTRTKADCERAKKEIYVSLTNFFGAPYGSIKEEEAERLAPFFEQIRNDADYFIQKLKKDFPRKRPYLYLKNYEPCVGKEVTGAYPSGHAVLSMLYAMVLSDFHPEEKGKFETRAKQIADDRVLSGMHHRSDIEAGQDIAAKIYDELKHSGRFQMVFRRLLNRKTKPEQAVIIHLNGKDLPEEIYKKYDLLDFEEKLTRILDSKKLGEYDGNETSPSGTSIFLYGDNADALFAGIEPTLREYPLSQKAKVVIRKGPPGSAQREVELP